MTLYRRIGIVVSALLVILQITSLLVSIMLKRDYLQYQLQLRAADSAASVAHAISNSEKVLSRSLVTGMLDAAARDDITELIALEVILDAIFIQGHYSSIKMVSSSGDVVMHRQMPIKVEGVPSWFVRLFPIEEVLGIAEVVDSQKLSLVLEINHHPGEAYLILWKMSQQVMIWLLVSTSTFLAIFLIINWYQLRPIRWLQRRAKVACTSLGPSFTERRLDSNEMEFITQVFERLFRKISGLLTDQVHMIEQVRQQAHLDPVTEIGNQNYFYARFFATHEMAESKMVGALFILRLRGFAQYNSRYGHMAGDLFLKQVAGRWVKAFEPVSDSIVAKRAGADFVAWLPNISFLEAEAYLESIFSSLLGLPNMAKEHRANFLHIGVAYSNVCVSCDALLNTADAALRMAQAKAVNSTHLIRAVSGKSHHLNQLGELSEDDWRSILLGLDEEKSLCLHVQPVLSIDGQRILNREVLLRLRLGKELIGADRFFHLIERLGLYETFDKLTVLHMINHLKLESSFSEPYSINLSPLSLKREGFIDWLLRTLAANAEVVPRLVFELPEHCLSQLIAKIQTLAVGLRKLGGQIALDRVGTGWKDFSYFNSMPLYAIKIDYSYVRSLEENQDYQFFVKSLVGIAHSRDFLILAGNVESQEQWHLLRSYGVDGGQGYYLSAPEELSVIRLQMTSAITDNSAAPDRVV